MLGLAVARGAVDLSQYRPLHNLILDSASANSGTVLQFDVYALNLALRLGKLQRESSGECLVLRFRRLVHQFSA